MGIVISRPVFISIKPQGFKTSNWFRKQLKFILIHESQARKNWIEKAGRRRLICFSSNGILSSTGKRCDRCRKQDDCLLKLRLYFSINDIVHCLELPETSYENYRGYTTRILKAGIDVKNVKTRAQVLDRGYWGEVIFFMDTSEYYSLPLS